VKFLPDASNFGRYLVKSASAFKTTGDTPTTLSIVWGLEEQDMSSCHKTNVSCTGETRYDNTFNLNTAEAQEALKVRQEWRIAEDIRRAERERGRELSKKELMALRISHGKNNVLK